MADINVIASFKVNNPLPADAKYLVTSTAGIDAIIAAGNAYKGMLCYNQADDELYIVDSCEGKTGTYKKLLAGTASEIGDLGDDVEELQGLHAKVGGEGADKDNFKSVAQEVTAGIEALDATVDSAGGNRVSVQVVEEDGKITAVTVAENDIAQKSELDKLIALHAAGEHDGYKTVQEEAAAEVAKVVANAPEAFDTLMEIADWIAKDSDGNAATGFGAAQRIENLETAVGAEGKAAQGTEGEEGYVAPVAATGLYKYVDEAVAAANSSAEDAIEALDATVDSTGGTKVSVQVVEEDGIIKTVTVAEDDIASAALLGTAADDATKETAFGKAAKAQAAADAAGITTVTFATSDADVTGSFANNTLTINNVASATDLGTAEGKINVLEGLHAAGETAGSFKTVAQEITAAIEALDTAEGGVSSTATVAGTAATADAAAVASTQHVQVTVEQENGIVSSVSVSEADIASKVVLDEEIARAKAAEKANADAIGKAKDGETAGTGLTGRIESLEALAGTTSVADQIDAAIKGLDTAAAGVSSAEATTGAVVTVKQVDGIVTEVSVANNDIASASDLDDLEALVGTLPATATATTVVGYVDEKVSAADGAMNTRVEALEGKHAEGKSVAEEVAAGIEGIAEASKDNGANDLVKVTVTTKAGSVTSVAVDDSALDTKIGDLGKVSAEEGAADHTVKSFVEAKVAEVNSAVEALDKDLTGDKAISSTDGKVTVGIKQEDGLITSLTVATSKIADADALANLQAVVGDNGPLAENAKSHEQRLDVLEGSKTTEGSVAYQIAQVVADAPAAFDTLKEIASWIGTGDVENTTAATMLADISALKTQVGTEAEGENAATGLVKDIRALEAKVGTTDVSAQITTAIEALDSTKFGGQDAADSTAPSTGKHVAVKVVETDGKLESVTVLENDIASADALAKLVTLVGAAEKANASDKDILTRVAAVEGLVGEDSVEDQIKAITGTPDADKTIQDEVDAVEGRLDALEGAGTGSVAEAKAAGDAALINTVTFTEGTAKAGEFANNTLTLTDIASETALKNLQAVVGYSELAETGATASTVTARLAALEEVIPCTSDEITALFTNTPAAE